MNLHLLSESIEKYKNSSQITRLLTEEWLLNNFYCPGCEQPYLYKFKNNQPAADFYCTSCNEEFELKSKKNKLGKTIADGAYSSMIKRVEEDNNPNLLCLTYSQQKTVKDLLIIPKHFFTANIIIPRKPLSATAKRAGWRGCSIDIQQVPLSGRIFAVKDGQPIDSKIVRNSFVDTTFLRQKKKDGRGWIIEIMNCIDRITTETFSLNDIYRFEQELKNKYPNNRFIQDKIRQQLQVLRDEGLLEFVSRGVYKKIRPENIERLPLPSAAGTKRYV